MGKRHRISKINIIDIEATCDDNNTGFHSELIQIAIVPLDLVTLEIREDLSFNSFVKNRNSKITKFCTDLTGITQLKLNQEGKPIEEVFRTISKKYSKSQPVAGYGWYDKKKMIQESKDINQECPLNMDQYVNIKNIIACISGSSKEIGLFNCLKLYGLDFKGNQHDAYYDAYNTARLYAHVLHRARKNL